MLDDFASEAVEVWPDNWLSLRVFDALRTQWRVGNGGRYGLDYGVITPVLRMLSVPRKLHEQVFDDIRIMESAALEEIHKGK